MENVPVYNLFSEKKFFSIISAGKLGLRKTGRLLLTNILVFCPVVSIGTYSAFPFYCASRNTTRRVLEPRTITECHRTSSLSALESKLKEADLAREEKHACGTFLVIIFCCKKYTVNSQFHIQQKNKLPEWNIDILG